MPPYLPHAAAFASGWIEHQVEAFGLPGCAFAIAHRGEVVFEKAFGFADIATREKLTPRHRFRIASHSKTFTAAGVMKLREAGRVGLDDPVGKHVRGLHPAAAGVTIAQVLAHAGGLTRDGADSGQFMDRKPWRTRAEILADLAKKPPLEAGLRFKYSNHGFALAGLVIEAVTGEDYESWMTREILKPSGLKETTPDMPAPAPPRFAHGHSLRLADGRRLVIPARDATNAVAAAGGYVATAGDVARFFASLAPNAERSVLSPASRRDMARRVHRDVEGALPWSYGLGTISGPEGDQEWFGHSGSFQGTLSRTAIVPALEITVSVMTNSLDGFANIFVDGILGILRVYAARGAPSAATRRWTGRYWSLWGAFELAPVKDRVLVAMPGTFAPLAAAPEIAVKGAGSGLIVKGSGFGSVGEPARLVRDGKGRVKEFWLGGVKLLPRRAFEAEARMKYGGRRRKPK